ncbi:MAG: archease [Candidatus Zixiibacteriota bacterium]
MARYEFIEHTADIAIRAFGDTLAEAFASAADAFFDIVTGKSAIRPELSLSVEAEGMDREMLLVNFLSKLIVVHEVDGWVLSDFHIEFLSSNRLKATARGEKFVESRHGEGIQIKGVSYHMMEIHDGGISEPSYVQVLFDI